MEMDEKYFVAKVQYDLPDENSGKIKKVREEKLVKGYNVTDVEAKVTKAYESFSYDWRITSVAESKIVEVVDFFVSVEYFNVGVKEFGSKGVPFGERLDVALWSELFFDSVLNCEQFNCCVSFSGCGLRGVMFRYFDSVVVVGIVIIKNQAGVSGFISADGDLDGVVAPAVFADGGNCGGFRIDV